MRLNSKSLAVLIPVIATLAACDQRSPTAPSAASAIVNEGSQAVRPSESGNGAPRGRHVFSFNLIGTPGDYEGGCGQGRRVFVERNARQAQIVFRDHDDGWHIEQCDATGGDVAEIHSDSLGTLDVYARILGKPSGRLQVCADTVEDVVAGETLCALGTIDLTREGGRSRFKVQADSLFDASLEDIMWNVDTNSEFRIVQFRVYQQ
ncbi:MAG TPA: hypothetical protein VL919_13760 [Vicinamibacterales bacterium]|jgi:hypothetical protein|nr:hypothetical protein [Vicinamibacterales bacterium]